MRQTQKLALLALIPALTAPVHAEVDDKTAIELVELSGLAGEMTQIAPLLQAEVEILRGMEGVSEAAWDTVEKHLPVAFAPATLVESLRGYFAAEMPEDAARAALDWLRSPLGKKITALERDGNSPAAGEALAQRALEFESGLTAERRALIEAFHEAVGTGDVAARSSLDTMISIFNAAAWASDLEHRPALHGFSLSLAAQKDRAASLLGADQFLAHAYSYRDLTDSELGRYVAFAETEPAVAYHRVLADAIAEVFAAAGRDLEARARADGPTPQ